MGFLVQGHTVHIPMPVYQITYKLMDGSSDWVHSGRKGKGVSWNMYQFWSLPLADWKGSHAIKLLTSNWLVRGGHSFGVLELESVLPVWIYSNGNALSLFLMMRILVLFVYYIYYFFWLHWVFLCCLFFFLPFVLPFSSCGEQASHWCFLLFQSAGSRCMGFSSCITRAWKLWHGMWNLPGPGIKPMSLALAGYPLHHQGSPGSWFHMGQSGKLKGELMVPTTLAVWSLLRGQISLTLSPSVILFFFKLLSQPQWEHLRVLLHVAFFSTVAHFTNQKDNDILTTTKDAHLLTHSETEPMITKWIHGAKEPTVDNTRPGYLTTYPLPTRPNLSKEPWWNTKISANQWKLPCPRVSDIFGKSLYSYPRKRLPTNL